MEMKDQDQPGQCQCGPEVSDMEADMPCLMWTCHVDVRVHVDVRMNEYLNDYIGSLHRN